MKRFTIFALAAVSLALIAAYAARAAEPVANSLTIYSSAQPGAVPAETVSQRRAARRRRAGLCGRASRARDRAQVRAQRSALHRRGRADRSDHGVVSVAHRSQRHARGRAELPVRPGQHRQAAAQVHRPQHQVEQTRGDKVETFSGTLLSTSGGLVLRAGRRHGARGEPQLRHHAAESARRIDHAADAGVGRGRRQDRARTSRALPIRRPASPGGRTTT